MKGKVLFICLLVALSSSLNSAEAKTSSVRTPYLEYKYQQKILRQEAKENYKRSLLPQSGYMSREEYENASVNVPNSQKSVPEYKIPQDANMLYVPHPTYSLVRYNNPPGSAELHIETRFQFDRQVNGGAITSPNLDILVYPVVYYYATNQCTAGDLFVVKLDKSLPDVNRILRANVVKRNLEPILSTQKSITEKFTFRTMTPVDFSPDGSKLVAKEKIGNVNDGIWKTNLWVYDFNTKQGREIPEVRDAIRYYWLNVENLVLDEKRWDIMPLGFDAQNPDRVIVSAYGYTGKSPKFLGNWSVDCNGQQTQLVSLFDPSARVSINGFKAVKTGVVNPAELSAQEKKQKKIDKKSKKELKKLNKQEINKKKQVYHQQLRELKNKNTID